MSTALAIPAVDTGLDAIALACVSRLSPHTQRAYLTPIRAYLQLGIPLSREGISSYLLTRKAAGAGSVTLNIALSALKLVAREVWIRGLLDPNSYNAIADLRAEKIRGQRLGNWTDEQGIEDLLRACENARERALVAIMAGCGLRRSEVAGLGWEQYQERVGRAVLLDIRGKGGRVRTVAVPEWARAIVDEYRADCMESAR